MYKIPQFADTGAAALRRIPLQLSNMIDAKVAMRECSLIHVIQTVLNADSQAESISYLW